MPACHIQRSIVINADTETVFDTIAEFNTWSTWSPWLCIDKQAAVTVTDDSRSVGSIYRWQGEVVGQGEIEHVKLDRPTQIDEELRFIKPFKSRADVGFQVQINIQWHGSHLANGQQTSVVHVLDEVVHGDLHRYGLRTGLKMLRELIETGVVLSDTEVMGVETIPAIECLRSRSSAPTNDVGTAMNKAFCDAMAAWRTQDGKSTETC